MRRNDATIGLGLVLICAGLLFLLQSLGVFGAIAGLLWAVLFAIAGAALAGLFVRQPAQWWAIIPGAALLGVALLILLGELAPAYAGPWSGALFLGILGLSFFVVYLRDVQRWWAIIPGGTLLTLAAIAGLSEVVAGADLGWVFFLGLALTFGLVAVVPPESPGRRWAIYPALVCLALAVVVMASLGELLGIVLPAAMILFGIYLAYRALSVRPHTPAAAVPHGPSAPIAPAEPKATAREVEAASKSPPPEERL